MKATMAKKSKRVSRKRKTPLPKDDEKQNGISGKHVANTCISPPAKLRRSTNKIKEDPPSHKKGMNTKKMSVSQRSSPPSKLKNPSMIEKGVPVTNFPDGWRRQVVVRKRGKTAGQVDIYFYSPEGKKLRSRPDAASYLAEHKCELKVDDFDFTKALKTNETVIKKDIVAKNSTAPRKRSRRFQDHSSNGKEVKNSSEAVSVKKSRSVKSSSDQPPASEVKGKRSSNRISNKAILEEKKDTRSIKKKDQMNVKSTCASPAKPKSSTNTVPQNQDKKMPVSFPLLRPSTLRRITHERNEVNVDEDIKYFCSDEAVPVTTDPNDWRSHLVVRKKGTTADQIDVYVVDDLLLTPFSSSVKVPVSNGRVKKKDQMNVKKSLVSPPARLKRSTRTVKTRAPTREEKMNSGKMSVSLPSSSPSKRKKMSSSQKGVPAPNLPNGWRRQAVVRKTGKSAGQIDIYFYSPDGKKLRSRPDVASYLAKHKMNLKTEEFDFSKKPKIAETGKAKVKNVAKNSTAPTKKSKNSRKIEVELKDSSKVVSTKMSRPVRKFPSQVPLPAGPKENGERRQGSKLIKKIFARQLKKQKKIII